MAHKVDFKCNIEQHGLSPVTITWIDKENTISDIWEYPDMRQALTNVVKGILGHDFTIRKN